MEAPSAGPSSSSSSPSLYTPLPQQLLERTFPDMESALESCCSFAKEHGFELYKRSSDKERTYAYIDCRRSYKSRKSPGDELIDSVTLPFTNCKYQVRVIVQDHVQDPRRYILVQKPSRAIHSHEPTTVEPRPRRSHHSLGSEQPVRNKRARSDNASVNLSPGDGRLCSLSTSLAAPGHSRAPSVGPWTIPSVTNKSISTADAAVGLMDLASKPNQFTLSHSDPSSWRPHKRVQIDCETPHPTSSLPPSRPEGDMSVDELLSVLRRARGAKPITLSAVMQLNQQEAEDALTLVADMKIVLDLRLADLGKAG